MKKLSALAGLFLILTACSTVEPSALPATATAFPSPTATLLPTPASPGNAITWDKLQVTLLQLEITSDYVTEYGSTRLPPPGQKFLWVHVQINNTDQKQRDVPTADHFSVLYAATELKPTYGHRLQYPDYTTLGPTFSPNQTLDGWLRFDLPTTAALKDLQFVYLPESSQVGSSFGSPNYPYADDKPTFVWNCVP